MPFKPSHIAVLLALALVFQIREADAAEGGKYKKTIENYGVPDVSLVNQNGASVKLRTLLASKQVVLVDFIFTTCTTICPVLSAGFANFQRKLGPAAKDVHLVSISIDPEHDTPARLREYLKRYDAKPGWDFLTGTRKDIKAVLDSFHAYTIDKMYHMPLALLHSARDNRWVRIYGLVGTSDLVAEYRELLGR
ncbi:MAG: SCO family protein [Nitrospiraceae bacterium]|nr:SCO family protein [Nitrospiraceae bacterium]